jgi:hypothetical protein
MRSARAGAVVVVLGLGAWLAGCGNTAGIQAPAPGPSAPPAAACTTPAVVALTVKNYLARCSVVADGEAGSTAVEQTLCVAPGPVPLSATARPGFVLGPKPWHRTDGDRGAGDPGTLAGPGPTSATTVTVAGTSGCAWACCPLPDGSGCPHADQCP